MIQPHDSVIVTTLSRLLIPLVQLYASTSFSSASSHPVADLWPE